MYNACFFVVVVVYLYYYYSYWLHHYTWKMQHRLFSHTLLDASKLVIQFITQLVRVVIKFIFALWEFLLGGGKKKKEKKKQEPKAKNRDEERHRSALFEYCMFIYLNSATVCCMVYTKGHHDTLIQQNVAYLTHTETHYTRLWEWVLGLILCIRIAPVPAQAVI